VEVPGRDWGVGEGELVTGAMGIFWDGAEDSMFTLYEILCTERTIVTKEHRGDYVQFTYGSPSWQSETPNGGGSCEADGWSPSDGPSCGLRAGEQNAVC